MGYFNPFFYNDSPLPMEQILWLFRWIKDHEETINNFDVVAQQIKKTLDDFDDVVVEKTTQAIQQMYDDGTLYNIIGQILTPAINSQLAKSFDIQFKHDARMIKYTGNGWSAFPETGIYDGYHNCQGGCTFMHDGVRYYADVCGKTGSAGSNSKLKIYAESNGRIPVKSVTLQTYHAQAMCYNPDDHCLYITKTSTESAWGDAGIYRYNMDTDELELQIINVTAGGPIWNESSHPLAWYGVAYNNGNIYAFKAYGEHGGTRSTAEMYVIDYENGTATYTDVIKCTSMHSERFSGVLQSLCCNDKYILALTLRPFTLQVFARASSDTDTTSLGWIYRDPMMCYNIPRVVDGYALGEPEDMNLDNDGNLEMTCLNDLNANQNWQLGITALTTVVRHFSTNIARGTFASRGNGINLISAPHITYPYSMVQKQYYVQWTSTESNPTGEADHPFTTCQEAIDVAKSSNCNAVMIIIKNVDGNNDELPVFVPAGLTVTFKLNGHRIGGVINLGGHVYIAGDGGTINQTCTDDDINAPLYSSWGGSFGVKNCLLKKDSLPYHLTCYNSDGFTTPNVRWDGTTEHMLVNNSGGFYNGTASN